MPATARNRQPRQSSSFPTTWKLVVMPGYEGDLAAMEDHAPMITLLRGGVVTIYEGGSPRRPLLRRRRLR